MLQTWRWFGPDDPVSLDNVRQAGAVGVVSALHHMNQGQVWSEDEVAKRRAEIEAGGLVWSVSESIGVGEAIECVADLAGIERAPARREVLVGT